MIRRIAIIHPYGEFDAVPSLVSLAQMLIDSGFEVHIFITADSIHLPPCLPEVRTHFLQSPKSTDRIDRWADALINWLPFLRKKIKQEKVDLIFGVDDWGIILATAIASPLVIPTGYYSLELLIRKEITTLPRKILKELEVYCSQRAKFFIIQDEMRADILSRENNIPRDQIVLLPNSYLGPATTGKTHYLHHKLGIPKGKKIILQAGTITAYTQNIPLAQASYTWGDDCVLVFHTQHILQNNMHERKFLQLIDNRHVYLSEEPVPHNEFSNLVSSADVGMALYEANPNKTNTYYLGLSSGRMAQCLRCGLPIIVSDLPLINDIVSQYRCGICIRSCEEIEAGLKRIWSDYESFRKGAIRCFEEKFRFEHNFPVLLDKIKNMH